MAGCAGGAVCHSSCDTACCLFGRWRCCCCCCCCARCCARCCLHLGAGCCCGCCRGVVSRPAIPAAGQAGALRWRSRAHHCKCMTSSMPASAAAGHQRAAAAVGHGSQDDHLSHECAHQTALWLQGDGCWAGKVPAGSMRSEVLLVVRGCIQWLPRDSYLQRLRAPRQHVW